MNERIVGLLGRIRFLYYAHEQGYHECRGFGVGKEVGVWSCSANFVGFWTGIVFCDGYTESTYVMIVRIEAEKSPPLSSMFDFRYVGLFGTNGKMPSPWELFWCALALRPAPCFVPYCVCLHVVLTSFHLMFFLVLQ